MHALCSFEAEPHGSFCLVLRSQADAERSLERLHEAAESQLKRLLDTSKSSGSTSDVDALLAFRTNLIGLTAVTAEYFDKLVKQVGQSKLSQGERDASAVKLLGGDLPGLLRSLSMAWRTWPLTTTGSSRAPRPRGKRGQQVSYAGG